MKKAFCSIIVVVLLTGCVENRKMNTTKVPADITTAIPQAPAAKNITALQERFLSGIDFIASGNEPFWSVEIDLDKQLIFKLVGADSLNVPAVQPIRLMDVAASSYRTQTAAGLLNIIVYDQPCINDMSGDTLPKKVAVTLGERKFFGCGQYLADYRLHDIWVLRSINDTIIKTAKKLKQAPVLELNLTTNKLYGNSSCNSINGTLEVHGDHMRLMRINRTKLLCDDAAFDAQYFSLLADQEFTYSIKAGMFTIASGNNRLVFQKVD